MTKEQAAKALGLDLGNIDWQKVLAIVQAILAIFAQAKQQKQAAGCDAHEAMMHDAVEHNLAAAADCLQCCCDNQPTP